MSEHTKEIVGVAQEIAFLEGQLFGVTDPAELNQQAANAGLLWASLKHRHATAEAARKPLQLKLRDELIAGGAKKTEAEDLVRADERYLAVLAEVGELERLRDEAEVLYSCLKQRAYLLSRTATVEA